MPMEELFDLSKTRAAALLEGVEYPWQALEGLHDFILRVGESLPAHEFDSPAPGVWVARNARVAPTAWLGAPCIIDQGAEVRHCAFIRENALVGRGCVVGNSTELKNALLFDEAQAPHYNYVGDSILGYRAHMGAGSITSNVKGNGTEVWVTLPDGKYPTGRRKVGAFLGDRAEIGCGTVLNPGTVVGRDAQIYPLQSVRGCVPAGHIMKGPGEIVRKR